MGFAYSIRFPVSRYILTKAVGRFDDQGDEDCQDITNMYRDKDLTEDERFAIFNSCRGVCKDTPAFEYQVTSSTFNHSINVVNNITGSYSTHRCCL